MHMKGSFLKKQLFVVDLTTLTCIHCDTAFYKEVCNRFVESTDYEDAYEMLDYIMNEEQDNLWNGFPEYIKTLKYEELFEVFHCGLDGGGLKPKPFMEADAIHPMFITVIQKTGYTLKQCAATIENEEHCLGIVEYVPKSKESWHDRNLENNLYAFNDTMEWSESDEQLRASLAYSKDNTQVYLNNETPCYNSNEVKKQIISVVNQKTVMMAIEIKKQNPTSRIAILNFANPVNPGGAVTLGYMGQEEELCRCSTLYRVLSDPDICGAYYAHNKALASDFGDESLIYSEGIRICKSDEEYPVRLENSKHIDVDVITMAAPYCGNSQITAELLYSLHYARAMHLLGIAAAKEAEVLILGAFGCGAFKNDPYIVCKAYKDAISAFPKLFNQIVFAIYCNESTKDNNYSIFCENLIKNND